ncbi:MAG: hypothetical protein M1493_04845, partial [Firmicutes bacterium]|nr:hypothetical protein [Bacillota bacterium]
MPNLGFDRHPSHSSHVQPIWHWPPRRSWPITALQEHVLCRSWHVITKTFKSVIHHQGKPETDGGDDASRFHLWTKYKLNAFGP